MELTGELELDRATRWPRVAWGVSPLGDVGQRGWSSWAQWECPGALRLVVALFLWAPGGGPRCFMNLGLRMHVLPPHVLWQPYPPVLQRFSLLKLSVNLQRCNCQRVTPLSPPPPVTSSVTSEASHLTSTCSGFISPPGATRLAPLHFVGCRYREAFYKYETELGLPVWKGPPLLSLGPVFTFCFPKSQRKMLCSARKRLPTCGSWPPWKLILCRHDVKAAGGALLLQNGTCQSAQAPLPVHSVNSRPWRWRRSLCCREELLKSCWPKPSQPL